jgi:hypothetical protein
MPSQCRPATGEARKPPIKFDDFPINKKNISLYGISRPAMFDCQCVYMDMVSVHIIVTSFYHGVRLIHHPESAPTMDPVPSPKAGSSFLYMYWLVRVPRLDRHFSPLNQVAHHPTSQVTIDSIHQHIITLNHIPSGNQTWQSTIAHVWMILPFKPAFYGGFPFAMFNYQRVTCQTFQYLGPMFLNLSATGRQLLLLQVSILRSTAFEELDPQQKGSKPFSVL